jgi:hypothetical protein
MFWYRVYWARPSASVFGPAGCSHGGNPNPMNALRLITGCGDKDTGLWSGGVFTGCQRRCIGIRAGGVFPRRES